MPSLRQVNNLDFSRADKPFIFVVPSGLQRLCHNWQLNLRWDKTPRNSAGLAAKRRDDVRRGRQPTLEVEQNLSRRAAAPGCDTVSLAPAVLRSPPLSKHLLLLTTDYWLLLLRARIVRDPLRLKQAGRQAGVVRGRSQKALAAHLVIPILHHAERRLHALQWLVITKDS